MHTEVTKDMKSGLLLLFLLANTCNVAAFTLPPLQRHAVSSSSRQERTRLFISTSVRPNQHLYHILGVTPEATMKEIKTAYRELAKKYHPGMFVCACVIGVFPWMLQPLIIVITI